MNQAEAIHKLTLHLCFLTLDMIDFLFQLAVSKRDKM